MPRNSEAGPPEPATAKNHTTDQGTDVGRRAGPDVAGLYVPWPRRLAATAADPDPERVRSRHRMAVERRHRRIVRALDELLGVRQYAPPAEIDYGALLLDQGVRERQAAGRWR